MLILFCQSPIDRLRVDEAYEAEAQIADAAGHAVRMLNFEALVENENVEKALRVVETVDQPIAALYRGWMMPPARYELLYNELKARNIHLLNGPAEYRFCHYLPSWLSTLGANTPETVILPLAAEHSISRDQLAQTLSQFGTSAVVTKDFVKSAKHNWDSACFIPDASDTDHALTVANNFCEIRGRNLQGGLVFRRFMKFRKLGSHSRSGMPLTEEYRVFILDGDVIGLYNYWEEGDYPATKPPLSSILPMVAHIPSRFFTVDFARRDNGELMIVELGDGQVSTLPREADAMEFYRALLGPARATKSLIYR